MIKFSINHDYFYGGLIKNLIFFVKLQKKKKTFDPFQKFPISPSYLYLTFHKLLEIRLI